MISDTIIPWTSEWLLHYEYWVLTGIWQGGGIEDHIGGDTEGMRVELIDISDYMNPVSLAAGVIHDNRFRFEGQVAHPIHTRLVIDTTPAGSEGNEQNWRVGTFYLENSDITVTGHIDSISAYYWSADTFRKPPVVTGSAMEDLKGKFNEEIASLTEHIGKLNNEYVQRYYQSGDRNRENMDRCIVIARQLQSLGQQKAKIELDFIENHPETIMAYDMAMQKLGGMYIDLTADEINKLEAVIAGAWTDFPKQIERLESAAATARRLAIGEKFPDIELINTAGESVMLSQYVPEGQYILLEFWASWCGPCRGEIPHLREVHDKYGPKGFGIINISIDGNKSDWEKAMEEEGMIWVQLCDSKGFGGPVNEVYNVSGVPTCIMLDRDGRFFRTEQRGAFLDATLAELYGE